MRVRNNLVFAVYFTILFGGMLVLNGQNNITSCGVDSSRFESVYEGAARIETYPWLGYLVYETLFRRSRHSTTVVLVTKQIVIATASEIDRIPKHDFRELSSVYLGHNCSRPGVPVRDYIYHPDYIKRTHSSLALIQLDVDFVRQELTPICPPPSFFTASLFYAMTITPNCKKPTVQIYRMENVDPVQCKIYYRKSGLDLDALWPTHTACGKGRYGGECLWRGGTVLALKQDGRWRLVGFGIYGPGCEAPARFLDYGMYRQWVRRSVKRTGKPSVTRIGPNHVILRRSLANLQRYGLCDREEIKRELYTEETTVTGSGFKGENKRGLSRVRYNMTVVADVEYSCVVFRADNFLPSDPAPKLRLRRWCAGARDVCTGFHYAEIDFYVEIMFIGPLKFIMRAYGKKAMSIDIKRAMKHINTQLSYPDITNLTSDYKGSYLDIE